MIGTSDKPLTRAPHSLEKDREFNRRMLLLNIAAACPRDAGELAGRIARPQQAIHEDLKNLIGEGIVHIHEGSLRTSSAVRIIAEAHPDELHEIHNQVLAELKSGLAARTTTLVALAESGCVDEALLQLLVRAVGEHPDDAAARAALATVAAARKQTEHDLRLLLAADAAALGNTEEVLSLTDGLLTSTDEHTSARAAILAAGAHIQENRLERAAALYEHVGSERMSRADMSQDSAWAIVAALGQGDIVTARAWRTTLGGNTLTSRAAGLTDLVDGLLLSTSRSGNGALELLARSVSALAPIGPDVLLPESPAALAALVAIGSGEPNTAEVILDRALKADLGGTTGRRRHLLLSSWSLMVQGKMDAAEHMVRDLGSPQNLCDREKLLYWCLQAGIARRRTDLAGMREAWREVRGQTFGMNITLYDLLPLGEMMVIAARLHDTERITDTVNDALALLKRLGEPITWSAPLHWHGVQAAFQTANPSTLIPHANSLVKAESASPYAAILAQAGNTWLEVLRREADFASVQASAQALAKSGHVWDAARLAGQAALQHPEREGALSLMQLAREISKDQLRTAQSPRKSSPLTPRELEVARLVLDGQGYRAIGEQLFISPKTVEHHVARIRGRLGASSRGELLEKLHDVITALDQ